MTRNLKNSRIIIGALLALTMLAALAGCGGEKQTTGGDVGGKPEQGPAIGLVPVAEAEVAAGEALQLDIPALAENADNETIAGFGADINAKLADWQAELGEGESLLVRALTLDTENYLSIVLTKNVAPNYGTDGEVVTYVYDKIIESAMSEDLAFSIGGMTDDLIAEALVNYLEADQEWLSFTLAGYAMAEDGKPVYFIQTDVEQEGADPWSYLYVLKNGQISGTLGQLVEQLNLAE